jgi:hypothetical protein
MPCHASLSAAVLVARRRLRQTQFGFVSHRVALAGIIAPTGARKTESADRRADSQRDSASIMVFFSPGLVGATGRS